MKIKDDPIVVLISIIGWGIIVVTIILLAFMLGIGKEAFNFVSTSLLLSVILPLNIAAVFILGFARIIELLHQINEKLSINVEISSIKDLKK